MNLKADPAERLIPETESEASAPRRRSLAAVLASLVVHVIVLAVLLYEQFLWSREQPPVETAIPLEVVAEPEPQPEPEPPLEPEKEQPKPKEKPPQQKIVEDEKPAFDAPRAANNETVEREAPDQETSAQREAQPKERQHAAEPSPEKPSDPQQQKANEAEAHASLQQTEEDKPDAEIIEKAEPKPETPPDEKQGQVEIKASPEPKPLKSIADQIASLAPLPQFKLAGASKPAPVSGGTARTSYLSILFGLIMRHMHIPASVRGRTAPNQGVVVFYVDARGNLTHQAVYRSSGFSALDAAALSAVRRAAPFPAPPNGHPHGIQFHYSPR